MDLNKKLEELKPYQLNCNVFDVYSYNGLSMQDLLCQFFTKINECITVSNETIDLAKWLVNEGLEIEVVKKLMIWLEDGTLENIINVNIFNTLNEKINGLSSQLEHKADIKNTCEYINAGAFGIYKNDKTKDSTKGINDAIAYCKSIGGGTVLIPAGTYLINDSIIVPAEVFLKGSGKCHEGGTVLWRNENTNIRKPFIILGSASGCGATLLGGISDFTIIGDSTVEDCIAIKSNSVGFHGVSIHDIDIEYFKGVPIMLESQTEQSRVQFVEIKNVDVGFDFNTYKPQPASPRTNNSICGGVWLKGYVDGVYIDNCRFTNYIDKDNMVSWLNNNTSCGVRVETLNNITPQNNFVIKNTFFRGFKSAIYSEGKNQSVYDCYIEHCKNFIEINAKDVSSLTNVVGNHISGCEKGILFADNRQSDYLTRLCNVNVEGNNINWGVFNKSYLIDVIGSPKSLVIYNKYNAIPNTFLSEKYEICTTNAKPYVYGVTTHNSNSKREILSKPRIEKEHGDKRGYYLSPNTYLNDDYGLDIVNEDNKKVVTFHENNTKLYSYLNGGSERTTVLEVDENGRIYCPLDIVLKGYGGKKYVLSINEGGQLFTQELK